MHSMNKFAIAIVQKYTVILYCKQTIISWLLMEKNMNEDKLKKIPSKISMGVWFLCFNVELCITTRLPSNFHLVDSWDGMASSQWGPVWPVGIFLLRVIWGQILTAGLPKYPQWRLWGPINMFWCSRLCRRISWFSDLPRKHYYIHLLSKDKNI